MRRVFSILLSVLLLSAVLPGAAAGAIAPTDQAVVVVGADLMEDQVEQIYTMFGLTRGTVPELTVTNAEERSQLRGLLDEAVIAMRSLTCVCVQKLEKGAGLNVTTYNISSCSATMYLNAMLTAGINDANVLIGAPYPVGGTEALTGVYKAYEALTGVPLDAAAKEMGTRELTMTGDLGSAIGREDSSGIIGDLKQILNETARMTDQQLHRRIEQIAGEHNVKLTERQIQQLITLCRSLEKLGVGSFPTTREELQDTWEKVTETKDKVVDFFQSLRETWESIRSFMDKVSRFIDAFNTGRTEGGASQSDSVSGS